MKYDYELLIRLYELHSPSRREKKMRKLLRQLCILRGATVETDGHGNLFVTKGKADTYPCICAHMDQVQNQHSRDFTVLKVDDVIMAYSPKSMSQQGLGADDKNGLWIALELLRIRKVLKCAFFVGEEIGCVGSSRCDLDFFSDVRYIVQPDRRNGGDLITSISGRICSEEFEQAVNAEAFGYSPCDGLSTDVGTLSHRGVGVSCINISCGYYHPHTDQECTKWSELCQALEFARSICKLKKTYKHEYELRPETCSYEHCWGIWHGYGKIYRQSYESIEQSRLSNIIAHILQYEPHLEFEEMCLNYPHLFDGQDVDVVRSLFKTESEKIRKKILEDKT